MRIWSEWERKSSNAFCCLFGVMARSNLAKRSAGMARFDAIFPDDLAKHTIGKPSFHPLSMGLCDVFRVDYLLATYFRRCKA